MWQACSAVGARGRGGSLSVFPPCCTGSNMAGDSTCSQGFLATPRVHCTFYGHGPWFTLPSPSSLAGNTHESGWRWEYCPLFWVPKTTGQDVVFPPPPQEALEPSTSLPWGCTGKPRPHVNYIYLQGPCNCIPISPKYKVKSCSLVMWSLSL